MHRKALLVVAVLLLLPAAAHAQGPNGRPFGLGLALGEPTGISGKYWFNEKNAVDMAIGYGYFPHEGGALFADYLYHIYTIANTSKFDFEFYLGFGGKLGFWHHHVDRPDPHDDRGFGIGVRIPFGLTMVFDQAPFDIFLELTPSMAFISPEPFYFDFDAALGGRFYF
jgi:hypothetical protein